MKRYPKLRKAAKWGGLGLAGVCAVAWAIAHLFVLKVYGPTGYSVSLERGATLVQWVDVSDGRAGYVDPKAFTAAIRGAEDGQAIWRPFAASAGSWWWALAVPLWVPSGAGLAVGLPAWLLDRRARRIALAGHCPKCRYDRSTLPPGSPCPECGAAGR